MTPPPIKGRATVIKPHAPRGARRSTRYEARHPKNHTQYASLDKLAADPRVEEIRDEGRDGIWVDLAPGYNYEGCISLHGLDGGPGGGTALQNVLAQVSMIEPDEP